MLELMAAEDRRYHWKAARLRLRHRVTGCWPLWLGLFAARIVEDWLGVAIPPHFGLSGLAALLIMAWLAADSYRATWARARF